jgi:mono/diheme cytochrome c family protein
MKLIGVLWFVAAAVCAAQPTLKNPFANDPRAAEEGRIAFRGSCALCHGIHAEGGRGSDLTLGTPLIVKDPVAGMAGAECGIRGFIDAYDADTGKRLWRFWTVPEPG